MSISALPPFLSEMRRELAQTVPDLERLRNTLSITPGDDPSLMEALEDYTTQLERIGQTAELIGLGGLSAWCAAFSGILPGVILLEGEARALACQHLAVWPALVDGYLQKPAHFDASLALAEFPSRPRLRPPPAAK